MSAVLALLKQLIACPSLTPNDAGCQDIISYRLLKNHFKGESLVFDDVKNCWLRYGEEAPLFVFAGHTDVVPTGPLTDWASPPFEAVVREDYLYGRGASDMKGALAAMVIAAEKFTHDYPRFKGSIAFLITSDEEGPAINGTKKVLDVLLQRQEKIQYALVGEPSSLKKVGDQIRIGRRGSLHGKLMIHGVQGHVAHPHLAINPIHQSMQALYNLTRTEWDHGNNDFPATTFQITNIHGGTGANNVIPGHLEVVFNFRFGSVVTVEELQERTEEIFKQANLSFHISWQIGALPFLTKKGKLIATVQKAINDVTGLAPILSTGGGTSDGRFISVTGAEVVELGVSHATAHQVNESVKIDELEILSRIYYQLLKDIFVPHPNT